MNQELVPKMDRVYLFGSGVNRSITRNYSGKVSHPPLGNDLFKIAFNELQGRFAAYDSSLDELFKYIQFFWGKKRSQLQIEPFDLEECFTLIQFQLMDAQKRKDDSKTQNLLQIQYLLIGFLVEVLNEFKDDCLQSASLLRLGKDLLSQRATIITFNYDDFIESILERASGENKNWIDTTKLFQENIPESELSKVLANSKWNWNRALGYGFEFDRVMLYDGSEGNRKKHYLRSDFYSLTKSAV